MKDIILVLKGIIMGIAEAIPGVSGGTIAFITGIYEELIDTIKQFNPKNFKLAFTAPGEFWKATNGRFLIFLLLGMAMGLIFGILVISHLLETDKELLWAFFCGIVLASGIHFARRQKWSLVYILFAIFGFLLAFFVSDLTPAQGSDNVIYLFLSGALAVSAMMLPGLSGSFVLLLLGLYQTVIVALKNVLSLNFGHDLFIVLVFGSGILIGLFSFARVLSYMFKKHKNPTMAFLIGILFGSLNKLWPWKLILSVYNKETAAIESMEGVRVPNPDQFKVLHEINVMPSTFSQYGDAQLITSISVFTIACFLIYLLTKRTNL